MTTDAALWSANFSPVLSTVAGTIVVGDVLTRIPGASGGYVLADATNLLTGVRPRALAVTVGEAGKPVLGVSHGTVSSAKTGLGSGAAGPVYVSSAGRLTRSGTGVPVGWCDTEGNADLDFSAATQTNLEGISVNVMQYYQTADGSRTVDGNTLLNVGPAIDRAWLATCALGTRLTLWIPPAYTYGCVAFCWDDAIEWNFASNNQWHVEIVGSGIASVIVPTRGALDTTLNVKLNILGGGGATNPSKFKVSKLFYRGNRTGTDATCLINVLADVTFELEDVIVYGVQVDGVGIFGMYGLGLNAKKVWLVNCGHSSATGAKATIQAHVYGAYLEDVQFEAVEQTKDPLGGSPFTKASNGYHVRITGDGASNSPTAYFVSCVFGDTAVGAVHLQPSSLTQDCVTFQSCRWRNNCGYAIRAASNVRQITVLDSFLSQNGVNGIALEASSVENLTIDRTQFYNTALQVNANTGQKSVTIGAGVKGGVFDCAGAGSVAVDNAARPYSVNGLILPPSLSGLELWLRADLGVTLVGNRVSSWADQSGTGDANKHAVQATAANRPTYAPIDTGYFGRPTLSFAGSHWLSSSNWTTAPTTTGTHFVVGEMGTGSVQVILCFKDTGGQGELYCNGGGATDLHYYQGADISVAGEADISLKHVYGVVRNGASSQVYQDAKTALSTANAGSDALNRVVIGAGTAAGALPLTGKVAEVISYNRVLNASEIGQVLDYLGARYGVVIAP